MRRLEEGARVFKISVEGFDALLETLKKMGYTLVGPRLRDGAIVLDLIERVSDLPRGVRDSQEAGRYRVESKEDGAFFKFSSILHSPKKFLYPPTLSLFKAYREGVRFEPPEAPRERFAFIGIRPCDLMAINILDKILFSKRFQDPYYAERRKNLFTLVVNCVEPGGTCFCASVGAGPKARDGFDLALTEVLMGGEHFFVVEVGGDEGRKVLEAIPHEEARGEEAEAAELLLEEASKRMGRKLKVDGLREALYEGLESKRWMEVAERCLSCGNCTLVCPTCFCTTSVDLTDLRGEVAERVRFWDSCFTEEHSYIHGGPIRSQTYSRYRQWLVHKLAYWVDQFGVLGCVGCGRCITWCPVGIDITEEAEAVRMEVLGGGGD